MTFLWLATLICVTQRDIPQWKPLIVILNVALSKLQISVS